MTTWKIIIEVILATLSLGMGNSFWSCVKSPKFLGKTLSNQEEIKKYISFIGKDKLMEDSPKFEKKPDGLEFEHLILITITSSIKATDKGRNLSGFILFVISCCSYFLSETFVLINLALFLLMWFVEISASAKNNVFQDISNIIRYIYSWNQFEPKKCKNFCLTEKPRFALIYKTLIHE
jgi:hypothetical protein